MNRLQQCELTLLISFLEVCKKLGIRYYLVCGSALGAVKYGGFIPWDDDIDAALPRDDYEAFLDQAPALLPGHLFLQNYRSDPGFPQIYSKLRDSRTTCIEESAAGLPIHQGIGLDIFPLDGCPEGKWDRLRLELGKKWYQHLLGTAFAPPEGLIRRIGHRAKRCLGIHHHTARIAAKYDALLRKYPPATSKLWCNHGNWQGLREYAPREQYGAGADMRFEGITVRVPEDFDAYLTGKYGNYRQDPPQEQQVSHHKYAVVDCGKPYTCYLPQDLQARSCIERAWRISL